MKISQYSLVLATISAISILCINSKARAQGNFAVLPLSQVVYSQEEKTNFYIHNRTNKELKIKYSPMCDIDGNEMTSQECLNYFKVSMDTNIQGDLITIAPNNKVTGTVAIEKKDVRYAIFKPLFEPDSIAGIKESNVGFKLNFQPGYLFLLKPMKERLSKPAFNYYLADNNRRLKVSFNVASLITPHSVSISARISEKKSGKMLRFVRLASDKIVDPKRIILELDGEFIPKENKEEVCTQLIIEMKDLKDLYKDDSCSP